MAGVVLHSNDVFPAGTSVGAYPASNWAITPPSGAPVGSAAATATVAADGSLTYTGLAETRFYAYASVSSVDRYVGFSTIPSVADGAAAATQASLDLKAPIVAGVNVVATAGPTQTLPDTSAKTIHYLTLTANLTLTFPTAAAGKRFTVITVQDSSPRTVTWPGTVQWVAASAPTLTATSGKRDMFSFTCADGTNWLGLVSGQNL